MHAHNPLQKNGEELGDAHKKLCKSFYEYTIAPLQGKHQATKVDMSHEDTVAQRCHLLASVVTLFLTQPGLTLKEKPPQPKSTRFSNPSRLDPSARRVEGGLADTRAEGESMSAEGLESACLKRLKDCLFPS